MFSVITKDFDGKLYYVANYADIFYMNHNSKNDVYMVSLSQPDKGYLIDNINLVDYDYYNPHGPVMAIIEIFCKQNDKIVKSIPHENQELLIFTDISEYKEYIKKHTKNMGTPKNEFENHAKSVLDVLNMAFDYLSNPDNANTADFINNMMGMRNKENKECKDCERPVEKKQDTSGYKRHNTNETSCSFSISVGNNGVHVYRDNDKCFINDTPVPFDTYMDAYNVLCGDGDATSKINSIKDILDETKANDANMQRIKELEASIAKAQKELDALKQK